MRMTATKAALAALAGMVAIIFAPGVQAGPEDSVYVVQAGTYDYLASPNFAGLVPAATVVKGQSLGLGTFDDLRGEFVLVGGKSYAVGTDGVPQAADLARTTPFLQAISFRPEVSVPVPPGTTCAQTLSLVDQTAKTSDGVIAVRLRGTFTGLTTRSVPGFEPPYPTLTQAVSQQTTFDLSGRRAVLVGFRTGPDFAGTGASGLHLHGVTSDRAAGGHVLSCIAGNDVQLSIQPSAGVAIIGH